MPLFWHGLEKHGSPVTATQRHHGIHQKRFWVILCSFLGRQNLNRYMAINKSNNIINELLILIFPPKTWNYWLSISSPDSLLPSEHSSNRRFIQMVEGEIWKKCIPQLNVAQQLNWYTQLIRRSSGSIGRLYMYYDLLAYRLYMDPNPWYNLSLVNLFKRRYMIEWKSLAVTHNIMRFIKKVSLQCLHSFLLRSCKPNSLM